MDLNKALEVIQTYATPVAFRLLGAIVIWIVGRWLIKFLVGLVSKAFTFNKIDPTLIRYGTSILDGAMTAFLALAVIDYMGIPTTGFAALAVGLGLAFGAAVSGILGNFAAGVFLLIMRPFKVGDLISGAGAEGRVKEIGMVVTKLENAEGEETIVPNGKLFAGNITNHSKRTTAVEGTEEVEVEFQVAYGYGHKKKVAVLKAELAKIEGVVEESIEIVIDRFTVWGPVLVAKLHCPPEKVLEVHAEMTEAIDETFGDMGFGDHPAPRVMYKDPKAKKGEKEEGEEEEEGEEDEDEEEEGEEGEEGEGEGEEEAGGGAKEE